MYYKLYKHNSNMTFKNVYICKPGCTLQPKEGKTNLQIREMEAMQTAMRDAGINAELTTIPWLSEHATELTNCAIICFNSAKCFDDDLGLLIKICSVVENIDLTLISNDCRLNFKLDTDKYGKFTDRLMRNFVAGECNIRILTNASNLLDEYIVEIIDWPHYELLPIAFSALYTLPAFMPGQCVADKTVSVVFACMHFKDYSEKRQNELIDLKYTFGDNMVLTGDMSGMEVAGKEIESIVTDTNVVWQWYKNAKTTPVLLEPNYDKYGVMPNRVAEAISCRCMPVLLTANIENYANMADMSLPIVQSDVEQLAIVLNQYATQYAEQSVQQHLNNLQTILGMYKTQFVVQLQNLYKL